MATLINGNGNLAIYAQQDADWYAALMGGQTVITAVGNQFAYELLDANTIGVKDGVIVTTEGRRIQLDANAIDSFDIPTGAQGKTNYYIIGYHLVTGNQSEQTCETFVQLMENGTDTIPEGSFRDGDDEVFISLYRVEQDDLAIGTITLLLPELSGSFQSQITELNNDLGNKVERMTNVSGYQTVDVLGYNPSTRKLGLKVNGADTVIPFSKTVDILTFNVFNENDSEQTFTVNIPDNAIKLIVVRGAMNRDNAWTGGITFGGNGFSSYSESHNAPLYGTYGSISWFDFVLKNTTNRKLTITTANASGADGQAFFVVTM